ncbi:MAG: hypothetical protein RLZZ290_1259, partial [Pseudomonadota bacterium]
LAKRHQKTARPGSEEEGQHGLASAPEITQAARGNGTEPKHEKRAGCVGHEVLPPREPEVLGDARHRRGKHQKDQVVHGVSRVEQEPKGE